MMPRSVAQPGRALRSGRRGRRFESSHSDQFEPLYSLRYRGFSILDVICLQDFHDGMPEFGHGQSDLYGCPRRGAIGLEWVPACTNQRLFV